MGTLLLVGEWPSTAPSATHRFATRRSSGLKGALERVGYDVVHAEDGAGALARLGQRPVDLIVLAGTVPDMEWFDLCAALRHHPAAEKVPFVLVAGVEGPGHAAARVGADLVFPPTIGPTEIAERLRR